MGMRNRANRQDVAFNYRRHPDSAHLLSDFLPFSPPFFTSPLLIMHHKVKHGHSAAPKWRANLFNLEFCLCPFSWSQIHQNGNSMPWGIAKGGLGADLAVL